MKKTIKIFRALAILLFALSLVAFNGCKDDDSVGPDDSDDTLIGKWKLKSATLKNTPIGDISLTADAMLAQSGTGAVSSFLQINEDGTAATTTEYEDGSDDTVEGTWSAEGDQLTVNGAGLDDTMTFRFNSGDLIITMTMAIDFAQDGNLIDIQVDMIYDRI
jgi:hypothetical protein